MNSLEINTALGRIKGLDMGKWAEFKGIRYATAKRWEYPVAVKGWEGVYDATKTGECSYQRRAFEDDEKCNAFYHKEFRKGMQFTYSEDCLFLNIWAPKNKQGCPVIVYIHGGSFTGGSADEGHISGVQFAENGVVLVAINYRLNAFGFCSHPDIAQNGACGNFGLYDQLEALKWVKDNIESFGGNPNNITLMGQSAGAMSIDILISSPLCKGWFKGAVMMSGAGMQRAAAKPLKPESTADFWNDIIKNAGVNTIHELREVDAKTLFYAWSDAYKSHKLSLLLTMPVYDGMLLTKESFKMSSIPAIPIILGETITDMIPIALEAVTKKYARSAIKNGSQCYIYNFNRNLPGDNDGAWHSADLLYAFCTLQNNWRPFEEIDYHIARQMNKMLCAFAESQNPNCEAIPEWSTGVKKPMRFCEQTAAMPWDTKELFKNTFSNKGAEF